MSVIKTRALVIKTQDIKEKDKLVWLFSEKLGKISTIAKGSKKSKSKLFSTTLQFCYGDYIVHKGRNFYVINDSFIIDSFQDLLQDLDLITYASYFCELIDISMSDEESNYQLFRYLVTAFYLLRNKAVDVEILARTFEIKILKHTGYALNLENCCICRKKINSSNYINFQYFGGVCKDCSKYNGAYVDFATYNTIKYLYRVQLENIYKLNLSRNIKNEVYKVLKIFIEQSYFRKPRSLDTLNSLTNFLK
ncbi:DNA repair protein RecO [Clostridium fermenticellae]|uniref:DNA repair protein RecO n=1 Tax=Clostridium fermenticellae TaxID=2068654 RepID=A0A386H5I4_9CLOT|nr:DNA repair protein RecO [Clostridium fermenticellae]